MRMSEKCRNNNHNNNPNYNPLTSRCTDGGKNTSEHDMTGPSKKETLIKGTKSWLYQAWTTVIPAGCTLYIWLWIKIILALDC